MPVSKGKAVVSCDSAANAAEYFCTMEFMANVSTLYTRLFSAAPSTQGKSNDKTHIPQSLLCILISLCGHKDISFFRGKALTNPKFFVILQLDSDVIIEY